MNIRKIDDEKLEFCIDMKYKIRDSNNRVVLTNLIIGQTKYTQIRHRVNLFRALDSILEKYKSEEYSYIFLGEGFDLNKVTEKNIRLTFEYFKNKKEKLYISDNILNSYDSNYNHESIIFWIGKCFDSSTHHKKTFNKKFLIMMNSMRPWRKKFLSNLLDNNLLDNALYSYNSESINEYGPSKSLEGYSLKGPKGIKEFFQIKNYFHSCFINVIVETDFENNLIFLTEKTDKPLLAKQPFIMVSAYKTLDMMKRIGFKTFDKWWSEEYDLIEDSSQRMESIIEVMNDINKWDLDKCKKVYNEMLPIIEHNYNRRMWIKNNHQHMDAYSDLKYLLI